MTTFHVNVRTGQRGCGAAHARYLLRLSAGLASRRDLVWSDCGNLPAWARDAIHFFSAADYHERANGISYREIVVALDRSLPEDAQIAIARDYIAMFTVGQKAYLAVIHAPSASDGLPQPHLHVMFCERIPDGISRDASHFFMRFNPNNPELGGCRKDSAGKHPSELAEHMRKLRSACAELQNRYAEANGIQQRVHGASYMERGLQRTPSYHHGLVYG